MKSCEDDNSDEYDLFSGFADWFEKHGLVKVIDIEDSVDRDVAIEAALAEIVDRDPLTVWVEGRNGYQMITSPTK